MLLMEEEGVNNKTAVTAILVNITNVRSALRLTPPDVLWVILRVWPLFLIVILDRYSELLKKSIRTRLQVSQGS